RGGPSINRDTCPPGRVPTTLAAPNERSGRACPCQGLCLQNIDAHPFIIQWKGRIMCDSPATCISLLQGIILYADLLACGGSDLDNVARASCECTSDKW